VPKTLFEKIIDKEIPATIVHEDKHSVAFRDINPGAPTHVLLVPRKPIPKLSDATAADQALLGHLLLTASKLAAELGVGDAFRIAINNGAGAGQSVFHLHLHIMGGRPMKWPPG
jgi:histidine triad (HIT) family protein